MSTLHPASIPSVVVDLDFHRAISNQVGWYTKRHYRLTYRRIYPRGPPTTAARELLDQQYSTRILGETPLERRERYSNGLRGRRIRTVDEQRTPVELGLRPRGYQPPLAALMRSIGIGRNPYRTPSSQNRPQVQRKILRLRTHRYAIHERTVLGTGRMKNMPRPLALVATRTIPRHETLLPRKMLVLGPDMTR